VEPQDNANNMCQSCEDYKELASVSIELLAYAIDPARTPFELMEVRMQVAEMFKAIAMAQNPLPPSDHNPDSHKTGS